MFNNSAAINPSNVCTNQLCEKNNQIRLVCDHFLIKQYVFTHPLCFMFYVYVMFVSM